MVAQRDQSRARIVEGKHALAQEPPTVEQLVTLRAAGHRGEVPSRLWAAELIGILLRRAVLP